MNMFCSTNVESFNVREVAMFSDQRALWGSLWNVFYGAAYGMCFMGQPIECALWGSLWNVGTHVCV